MSTENRADSNPPPAPVAATAKPASDERRVLILAPTGNDARLTAGFLADAGLAAEICRDPPQLCDEIARGCGAIILAEENLGQRSIINLVQILDDQPSWSDIPIVLITSGGEVSQTRLRRLAIFGPGGNVILLERPCRPGTLVSTVEVALRARLRQYEARDSVEALKRAHDEIKMASQAKDAFLAALSHELRTPLNPALLLASEFARDPQLPAEVRENFEIIRKNIELEARLIDDLLDLTRVTNGKMVLQRQLSDAHAILMDALDTVRAECQAKNIRLVLHLDARRHAVEADMVRLQQVFWNVLKNAVKFTPTDGTITVETSVKDGGRLLIKISDTGIGLAPDEAPQLFKAFVQGTHRFGGLGLGLAISKSLVELHSGTIVAESAGRNRGSTFKIELPLASEAGNAVPAETRSRAAEVRNGNFSSPAVLLVEDHETTRATLTRLLSRRNYRVVTADCMVKAREIARQNKFDFLISDIGLPDGNGNDLMNELRENYGMKGIAITGYGMEKDIARSKAAGFVTHLIKPVRIESLEIALTALRSAL
jgi:signal transduction histidine kinase/CheY-like chemotaxis protein